MVASNRAPFQVSGTSRSVAPTRASAVRRSPVRSVWVSSKRLVTLSAGVSPDTTSGDGRRGTNPARLAASSSVGTPTCAPSVRMCVSRGTAVKSSRTTSMRETIMRYHSACAAVRTGSTNMNAAASVTATAATPYGATRRRTGRSCRTRARARAASGVHAGAIASSRAITHCASGSRSISGLVLFPECQLGPLEEAAYRRRSDRDRGGDLAVGHVFAPQQERGRVPAT